jgi:hypothetical protein
MVLGRLVKTVALGVASLALAGPASAAPTIGVGAPTATITNFGPGRTATGTGSIIVTAVLTAWTLTVSDPSHAGHLVPGATGCSGAETQTVNPLTVSVSGVLGSTVSAGTKTISAGAQAVASGNGSDTLTASYSLVIGPTEQMPAACVFSTPVTWTVQ